MLLSWHTESHVEGQQESSIVIFPLGPHNKLIRPLTITCGGGQEAIRIVFIIKTKCVTK